MMQWFCPNCGAEHAEKRDRGTLCAACVVRVDRDELAQMLREVRDLLPGRVGGYELPEAVRLLLDELRSERDEQRNCVRCGGLNMDHLSHCENCRAEDWCCSDGYPLSVEEAYALRNERDELAEKLRQADSVVLDAFTVAQLGVGVPGVNRRGDLLKEALMQRDSARAFIDETDNAESFRQWLVFVSEEEE